MNRFDIFVDSAANIPEELLQKHDINVITYFCTVNGAELPCYEHDKPFSEIAKKFYDDMRSGADVKTSCVSTERIIEAIEPAMSAGKDAIIITISSGISGTHSMALKAKKVLEEKYPSCRLFVCDSANASMGEGLLAIKAADLRDMGESAQTCAKWIERNAYKVNSYFTVGDLKYLRKGGRISATLAIAGTILNIKPILRADAGVNAKLAFFCKERGRKKALIALADAFSKNVEHPESQSVAICHADCLQDAEELADMVKARGASDVIIEYYDMCTGSHAGPGTVALFFYGKDRRAISQEAEKSVRGKTAKQKL